MLNVINVSEIFLKSNFKKFISSILSLVTFLLIANLLLGFILSTTGVLSDSLADNNTMHFMEILIDSSIERDIEEIRENLQKIKHVESIIWDYSHPILLEAVNSDSNAILNIIGIPKAALKYFGAETDKEEYFFIPSGKKDLFDIGSEAIFEEGEYVINDDGKLDAIITDHYVKIDGYYKEFDFDMLPPELALIDEARMLAIVEKMSPDGKLYVKRVILTVDDISYMKEIETQINKIYPDVTIRYSLKYSKDLPAFSVILIAGSSIIILFLLIICVINIRNNVNQILNTRNRDIGLLSLFGTDEKNIKLIFILEFAFYGFMAFIFSTVSVALIFGLFKLALNVDLLTNYFYFYVLLDLIISVVIFCLISIVQINSRLKKLNKEKLFKEFLK
ncbi:FtsX-like permease family protein [Herbinix hemicellulosilytica]|uniref:ABC3 transporter permease C-terminal domain-containing protein n=1 Tax=Herbinix hemicellulosilytica TaxID=1564487 RepID=A0A0H5SUH1_HERHM|nr:ABC transporter permease [Herbinix hemicellulosilytica]RBP59011.1 FtsX-like permease family protein [Herbinix hemicellulosilytica]CRZ33963.1 hypothetical protein HHT355_0760 [Herbinix hemicellulosilytica]